MRGVLLSIFLVLAGLVRGWAHDGLELPPPESVEEAWNEIELCRGNIEQLVETQQWLELPAQATLSNQALRFLQASAERAQAPWLAETVAAEQAAIDLYDAATRNDGVKATRMAGNLKRAEEALAERYPAAVVKARVYACPMCRGVRELDGSKMCPKCGMPLVPRVIPASSLYNTPGEPSMTLTLKTNGLLRVGREVRVEMQLRRKRDGAAVKLEDLLVVHTQPIHLLIVDEGLTDYHHEHPMAAADSGVLVFGFTPRKPGAYRVFADVCPAGSSVQEYIVADLPGAEKGAPVAASGEVDEVTVNGLRYELLWERAEQPLQAGEGRRCTVRVSEAKTGAPYRELEPVMGAFAHVVAFHEDRETVIHIHPMDATPLTEKDRGGPEFTFQFFPPKPGTYRLFAQVQIRGKQRFAPLVVECGRKSGKRKAESGKRRAETMLGLTANDGR